MGQLVTSKSSDVGDVGSNLDAVTRTEIFRHKKIYIYNIYIKQNKKYSPTNVERLILGDYYYFDFTVDEGMGRLNPSSKKK